MKHHCILCESEQTSENTITDLFTYCDTCANYYGLFQIPCQYPLDLSKDTPSSDSDYRKSVIENHMLFVLHSKNSTSIQKLSAQNYLIRTLKRNKEWIKDNLLID